MKKQYFITNNWKLQGFCKGEYDISSIGSENFDCRDWYDVQVPGDVHTTLVENNVIANPLYKQNDLLCQWVEKKVWIYRTEFWGDEEIFSADCIHLLFEGLDTYADVYINGVKMGSFANALVEHRINITSTLKKGKNVVVVIFDVMSDRALEKGLPEGFWINYSTERAYARKPAYSFGWDWAPRLATIGIWKPVILVAYTLGRIDSVQIKTIDLRGEGDTAVLEFIIGKEMFTDGETRYHVSITDCDGRGYYFDSHSDYFKVQVENARLWWTHDLGNPHLYDVRVEMYINGKLVDFYECRYGIRKIEIKQRAEDGSSRFIFSLNEVDMFCCGANWVPISSFLGMADDSTYRHLLELAKDANMNMICLWGGGIYEKDVFYNYCDQLGILVWQYFMFACGEYPDYDRSFLDNVRDEIEKAVKRLRNHASIAIWVGNVENQMLCQKIGLDREMYGKRLFEELIPQWLKDLDDTRFYWPSSPYGGRLANSMDEGDRHNWDVWFTDIPYTEYAKDTTRFASEFGIHAAPVQATVEKYARIGIDEMNLNSYEFNYFNKDQSLDRMRYLMAVHTGCPADIDQYIDYSMLIQAEGLQFATEHYRRRFPQTAGALVWQFNDCCPCQSWSMIDYDLIPKASYYYSKRFFQPLMVSLEIISSTTTGIWIINNTLENFKGLVQVYVKDFFGNVYFQDNINVDVAAGTAMKIKDMTVGGRFYKNVIIPCRNRNVYVSATLPEQKIANIRFFGEYKDVPLPNTRLMVSSTSLGKELRITITADRFARFVKLDGEMNGLSVSDNYFNLEAEQTYTIKVRSFAGSNPVERKLYIKALNSQAVRLY
jgi:beta-mannosidase